MHVFLALFVATLVAEQLPVTPDTDFSYPLHVTTVPAPAFTRTVALDIDGDSLQDICMLRGTDVDLMIGPGVFEAVFPSRATGVNDIAALDRFPLQGKQSLLTVGDDGAVVHHFDWGLQAGPNGFEPVEQWVTTTVNDTTWEDAVLVKSRDNGGTSSQIYGVMDDGETVRSLTNSGTGYLDSHLFSVSETILELSIVDWVAGGDPEVCVLTGSGIEVFEHVSGAPGTNQTWQSVYVSHPPGFTPLSMTAGQGPGAGEWVAWSVVLTANPVHERLIIADASGYDVYVLHGPPTVIAMSTGDWDGDGDDDVMTSSKATHDVVILENIGTSEALFDTAVSPPGAFFVLQTGASGSAPNNEAHPVFVDLDNDDQLDWCMPIQSTGKLFVDRNGPTGTFDTSRLAISNSATIDESGCGTSLHIELSIPVNGPSAANALECVLFSKADANSSTEAVAVATTRMLYSDFPLDVNNDPLPVTLDLSIGQQAPFDEIYFWIQWPVKVAFDSNGDPTGVSRVFTPAVYGLQGQAPQANDPPNYSWLLATQLNQGGSGDFGLSEWDCVAEELGVLIGSGVPLPCLPNIESGHVPYVMR